MAQKQGKRAYIALAAFVVLGVAGGVFYRVNSTSSERAAAQSALRAAPTIGLKDDAGKAHTISEAFDGGAKLAVVHFWAHWCPPCLEEIPKFLDFARSKDAAPYRFIAVSEDPNWEEAHKSLPASSLPPGLVSVIDPDNKVSELYGTYQFPETYIVRKSKSGKIEILTKWVGPQDWGSAEISNALARLSAADNE